MSPAGDQILSGAGAAAQAPSIELSGGEIVILAIKPSLWFIVLVSLPVLLSVATLGLIAYVGSFIQLPVLDGQILFYFCLVLSSARLLFAGWQWVGRTYMLTNRRIISVRSTLNAQVTAVPLVQLSEVVLARPRAERLFGTGSICCLAGSSDRAAIIWHMVAKPEQVQRTIQQAIQNVRQPGRQA